MSKTIQTGVLWTALLSLLVASYMVSGEIFITMLVMALAFYAGLEARD